jgi:hypothetical protein
MITNVTNTGAADLRAGGDRPARIPVAPRVDEIVDARRCRPVPLASSLARLEVVERHLAALRTRRAP